MNEMKAWWFAAGSVVSGIVLGYLFRAVLLRVLERWFARTETKIDDVALSAFRRHVPFWFLLLGLSIGMRFLPTSIWYTKVDRFLLIVFILSLAFSMASLAIGVLRIYATRLSLNLPASSLTENLIRLVIIGMGGLLILSNLGISITPLLTALGVGSLAVAMALQDTLSNLFAGFYMLINQQVRVGDYIKLDSGQEGYVTDIGWRATQIRELPGNLIIVPNAKLSQAIVINYYYPDKDLAVLIQVGVSYRSDLAAVENVTCEVAREVMKSVVGGVPAFEPFIRYHTLGDSSINFSVIMRGKEYVDQHLIRHEFIKRLHARYAMAGIEIPFPQRVVHIQPTSTRTAP